MTLIEFYRLQKEAGQKGEKARILIAQTHWLSSHVDFDPKTGEIIPQNLSTFLKRIAKQPKQVQPIRDRLWRIIQHAQPAIMRLFYRLNENPKREQALLPIHAVKGLDTSSFIKLSQRPGRNIREKLASHPYLYGVRRFQSVDLTENRLLKALVIQLAELIEWRQEYLNEAPHDLLPHIQSWLLSKEAQSIASWNHVLPNNTLLSHRDYRRIWDAWRWLQSIDEDIKNDFLRLEERQNTLQLWQKYGQLYADHLFADMPVFFDYDTFKIEAWTKPIFKPSNQINRIKSNQISELVCIDLAYHKPYYTYSEKKQYILPEQYIWQRWQNTKKTIDILLFYSDAIYFHSDTQILSLIDLFLHSQSEEHINHAALAFTRQLRNTFQNNQLIWLFPDYIHDLQLSTLRRNLNAYFTQAEPLPRSIAAVFHHIDHSKIKGDGFIVVVIDQFANTRYATKLIARFDQELKQREPESYGFYWERHPSVILSDHELWEKFRGSITVNEQYQWQDHHSVEKKSIIDPDKQQIGHFDYLINSIDQTAVTGGIRLHQLQKLAGDIPLWRDHIPELSIRVMIDGLPRHFYLVDKNTTIRPIRGQAITIKIEKSFWLPAGKSFYSFPLYIGENSDDLGYEARLQSNAFPLIKDTECHLHLIFEYGADEPYQLIFEPLDASFPPVKVNWKKSEDNISDQIPVPQYPRLESWSDLSHIPKKDQSGTTDLMEWVLNSIDYLDKQLFIRPKKRYIGQLKIDWKIDKNGYFFNYAIYSETEKDIFIHQNSFVDDYNYDDFSQGDYISFEIDHRGRAVKIADPYYVDKIRKNKSDEDVKKFIRKSIYFPLIKIWSDGRSINDIDCPVDFRKKMKDKIIYLDNLMENDMISKDIKREIIFLLSSLHKDTTQNCILEIKRQISARDIWKPKSVGFILGDLSQKWQKEIFNDLLSNPNYMIIKVFSYSIWREKNFVHQFKINDLEKLSQAILFYLDRIDFKNKQQDFNLVKESFELLLGLLRTRESDDEEIKKFFYPHQKIVKQLARQVDRINEIIIENNYQLPSRLELDVEKPKGSHIPDLVYALTLYLTGEDSAHSIHIESIITERD